MMRVIPIGILVIMHLGLLFPREADTAFSDQHMNTFGSGAAELMPSQSVININNMAYWMKKSSAGTTSGSPNGTQADYPIGTGGLIFEDGMLWGVKVTDGNPQSPRVGGTTFFSGLKAGRVVYDASGNVIGSTDPADHHVWRVRKDYMTADLTADAANFGASIDDVYAQYDYDWNNWPADWGAPYEDVNGDGSYDPLVDKPGYPGADQTLWVVTNDVPEIVDATGVVTDTLNTAPNVYGADPVGIELQVTMWAYKFGASDPLGNIIFKKATMKYTGLPTGYNDFDPTIANLDTVYFTQWSDPDLGTYTDDYVGCDIDLSLGYVYNGNALDGVFNGIYNMSVPAGGYDFLQGPEVDGEYLPMTSFTYSGAGSSMSDPDLSVYQGTLQFFNLMEGFLPRPEYPVQTPWTNPITGETTKFVLSGDPLSGTGWVDGVQLPPGDRRFVMASGPFSMALGESQDVVLALIGGHGSDNLSSIVDLKYNDRIAQIAYDHDYTLLGANATSSFFPSSLTQINITANVINSISDVTANLIDHAGNTLYQLELYDDGSLDDSDANAKIFGNSKSVVPTQQPLSLQLTLSSNASSYNANDVIKIVTDGPIVASDISVVNDENEDYLINPGERVLLNLSVENQAIYAHPGLVSNIRFIGPIDNYEHTQQKLNEFQGNGIYGTSYSYNDISTYSVIQVSQSAVPGDEITAVITIFDEYGNFWNDEYILIVSDFVETPFVNYVEMDHIAGSASGTFGYRVYQPSNILNGHTYEILLDQYSWGLNRDVSQSTITGIGYTFENENINLRFVTHIVSQDYDLASGIELTFNSEITINSATGPDGIIAIIDNNLNTVLLGNNNLTGGGGFSGGEVITVNIDPTTLPISVDYIIYDDGWATLYCADEANSEFCYAWGLSALNDGGGPAIVNAEGTCVIDEITEYEYEDGQYLFTLIDITASEVVFSDQFLPEDNYALNIPITDGFKIVKGNASYEYPIKNYISISDGGIWYGSESNTIGSYYDYGWAQTAMSVDTYGSGTTDWGLLSSDVKVVWDGVYGDPDANGFVSVVSGGSKVWIYVARNYPLDMHTSPENPGTGDPFLITVPFKVYDLEPDGGGYPVQVSAIIHDRMGNPSVTPFYAFNPSDRMYTEFVLRPYEETLVDFASNEAFLTWNTVWWGSPYELGDTIRFEYGVALSSADRYQFTPSEQNPPVAHFELVSGEIIYGEPAIFDASSSYDPDGEDLTFSWSCKPDLIDLDDRCYIESTDDAITSIEFLTVGHYTITMTVSDGTFNISTTQEVVVEANLDNMPVEWTYVDSSWLENVDVSGNTWVTGFNTFFIGDTLLTFSRFSTELKIFEIENNTLSHQKDISIDGEVKNWGNNRLFLVRGTDQSFDAFTGALYIYEVGEDWQLTPILENYLMPTTYSNCNYCSEIISIQQIDDKWYFIDYKSIYRMDLSDPANPQVMAQKNYEANGSGKSGNDRPYIYDAGYDYIYAKWTDSESEVGNKPSYVDVLTKSDLFNVSTLNFPDSIKSINTIDGLLFAGFDGYASIYSISNPLNPQYLSEISIPIPEQFQSWYNQYGYRDNIHSIYGIDNKLIVVKVESGEYIYNILDPSSPVYEGSMRFGYNLNSSIIIENQSNYYMVVDPSSFTLSSDYEQFKVGISKITLNPYLEGCTNPNAINYDSDADIDDGSCCLGIMTINEIDYCSDDFDILNKFIENSSDFGEKENHTLNLDNDHDGDGLIQPWELGDQEWKNGRLEFWDCSNCGLSGVIPSEINQLIFLRSFNLSKNYLSGEIPDNLGLLDDLISINLTNNYLSGNIPEQFRIRLYSYYQDNIDNFEDLAELLQTSLDANNFCNPIIWTTDLEVTLNNQRCEIDFEILYPNDWGSKFIGNESIPIIILGVNFVVGDTDEGLDGHIHYNIDRDSNDFSDYSISFESSFDISFNSGGEHILKIWLVDNNHNNIQPIIQKERNISFYNREYYPNLISISGPPDNILSLHSGMIELQFSKELHPDSWLGIQLSSALYGDSESGSASVGLDGDNSIIQLEYNQLTSGDQITIELDANEIRLMGDETYEFTMGEIYGDTSWIYNVEYLGDYNHSGYGEDGVILDSDDINMLIEHWGEESDEDYQYELGPCSNGNPCLPEDAPYLKPAFDNQWDIEDLTAFVIMWNWSSPESFSNRESLQNEGMPIIMKINNDTLLMLLPDYNLPVHHIWFQTSIEDDQKLTFTSLNFNEQFDLTLNRSYPEENTIQWSLISFDGRNDINEIALGVLDANTKKKQSFEFQYKLNSKNNFLSSGSQILTFSPIPDDFELSQAYPNPFNPVTTLRYALPVESDIVLSVYDIQGRLVTYLANELKSAGYYEAVWNASNHASGMYFIRMNVYNSEHRLQFSKMQKIILVK